MKKVSIVVPCYNEEESIPLFPRKKDSSGVKMITD